DEAAEVVKFGRDFGVSAANNDSGAGHELDVSGLASIVARTCAHVCDVGADRVGGESAGKDNLGVSCGKFLACVGSRSLVENRSTLTRRFAQMRPGHLEVLADMVDVVNFRGICVDPVFTVADH